MSSVPILQYGLAIQHESAKVLDLFPRETSQFCCQKNVVFSNVVLKLPFFTVCFLHQIFFFSFDIFINYFFLSYFPTKIPSEEV